MERGAVYVELRARMEQFERDLDDAINRTKQKTDTASKAFSSSLTGVGQTMTKTLTPAAVAFGAFALQAFRQADAGLDTLRVKSGLTGDALADLQDSFKDVAGSVTSSLSEIGTVMGELQQRTGLTGDALEELTIQVLNLNEIGNQGSVETITRVFGDWSIATDDQTDALDALFRASQATGPSVDALGQLIVRYGAPLRQMGFGFEQSAALLGKFEKEGVNTELVMGSLRIALGKLARAGVEDVPAAFREMVTEIENAGSAGEANALALELFGARAGPDMAAAIREGRFAIGDLWEVVEDGSETIKAAREDTIDWTDKLLMLKNRAQAMIGPVGEMGFAISGVAAVSGPAISGLGKLAVAYKGAAAAAALGNTTVMALSWSAVVAGLGRLRTALLAVAPELLVLTAAATAYIKVTDAMGDAQEATAQSIESSGNLIDSWIRALAEGRMSVEEYQHKLDDLEASMQKSASPGGGVTEMISGFLGMSDGIGVTSDQVAHGRKALSDFNVATEGGTRITEEYTSSLKELTEQREEDTAAAREQWAAELALADGFLGVQGAFLQITSAQDAYSEAMAVVQRLEARGKKGTEAYKEAVQSLSDAELALITSQLGLEKAVESYTASLEEDNAPAQRQAIAQIREAGIEAGMTRGDIKSLVGGIKDLVAENDEAARSAGDAADGIRNVGGAADTAGGNVKDLVKGISDLAAFSSVDFDLNVSTPSGNGDGPGALGMGSGPAATIASAAAAAVPGDQWVSSGYRSPQENAAVGGSPSSYHLDASNPAQDIVGTNLIGTFHWIEQNYGSSLRELLYTPAGYSIKNGQVVTPPIAAGDHYDHVHLADYGALIHGPAMIAQGNITEAHIPLTGPGAQQVRESLGIGGDVRQTLVWEMDGDQFVSHIDGPMRDRRLKVGMR